jgi:RNA recognition motif-containing protein
MNSRLYVGNLPSDADEDEIRDMFESYGRVESVTLLVDRNSRQFRGFGFVDMDDEDAAENAIAGLNGLELRGRRLRVNEARPKSKVSRPGRPSDGRRQRRERAPRFSDDW